MSPSMVNCTKSPTKHTKQYSFSHNHEEADPRIFWLCSIMKGDIIHSTDTDLLAIALIKDNQLKLRERNIIIHFRKAGKSLFTAGLIDMWNLSALPQHTVYWQHETLTCWRSLVWCTLSWGTTYYYFFVVSLKTIASRRSTSTSIPSALNQQMMLKK